uniref:Uncharacterized protein n=1 Tax=Arundo donax TaxID=35708 RepID=A0A0A9D623_ARUDO
MQTTNTRYCFRGRALYKVGWADMEEEGVGERQGRKKVAGYERRQPLSRGQQQRRRLDAGATTNVERAHPRLSPAAAHFGHRETHGPSFPVEEQSFTSLDHAVVQECAGR